MVPNRANHHIRSFLIAMLPTYSELNEVSAQIRNFRNVCYNFKIKYSMRIKFSPLIKPKEKYDFKKCSSDVMVIMNDVS